MAPLAKILPLLKRYYGPPPSLLPSDPFELILWENVAYLADDTQRRRAFDLLRTSTGTKPAEILAAKPAALRAVTKHGILPEKFAAKLREAARIALKKYHGDLKEVVGRPVPGAMRSLRKFPGIGEPGAEKILLFSRQHAFLAPDSNILRVLARLGLVAADLSYTQAYAAARKLAEAQLCKGGVAPMMMAHQLLRRHGQELCKRNGPLCNQCPLIRLCPSARLFAAPASRRA